MDFQVASLLTNISHSEPYTQDPHFYESAEDRPFNLQVSLHPTNLLITSHNESNQRSHFDGLRIVCDLLSNTLKNIRHEIVSSLASDSSDVKFSEIDPEFDPSNAEPFHELSPDYFEPIRRTLGELSTSAINDDRSLLNSYNTKLTKYTPYLERCRIDRYYILVVSPRRICTNMTLTNEIIEELCARCRLGLSVEAEITNILGQDIFTGEEDSSTESLVKSVLLTLEKKWYEEEDFSKEIFEHAKLGLTPLEEKHVLDILKKTWDGTSDVSKSKEEVLEKYLSAFTLENTREKNDIKRIANVPFILPNKLTDGTGEVSPDLGDFPSLPVRLQVVWWTALEKEKFKVWEELELTEEEKLEIKDPKGMNKHRNKKDALFSISPDRDDIIDLARTGIQARRVIDQLVDEEEKSHKGFHPLCYTKDIENFIDSDILSKKGIVRQEHDLLRLLEKAKEFTGDMEGDQDYSSLNIFKNYIMCSELIQFNEFVTDLISEIAYNMHHYTKPDRYLFKQMRSYNVGLVMHTSGEHIFVSFCVKKDEFTKIVDTGRLGPTLYESETYIFTDFCSYNKGTLEHLLKAGPYMSSLMSHMISSEEIDIFRTKEEDFFCREKMSTFWTNMKTINLVFLSNKRDCEEAITSSRFLYMNIMDEIRPNPFLFVERLPEVLRSRMTSYIVARLIKYMRFYYVTPLKKTVIKSTRGDFPIEYINLKSFLTDKRMSIDQMINMFYYGYVVSKERDQSVHSSYSICKKLFKEEFKYLRMKEEGKRVLSDLSEPSSHQTDLALLKWFLKSFESISARKIGPNHKDIFSRAIIKNMARATFSELATLKASAKSHDQDYPDVPDEVAEKGFSKVSKFFREKIKVEYARRPKTLEAITIISDEWESKNSGKTLEHVIQLVPTCLDELEEKNGFDSDLFSKSQHGGDREIHVLEMRARVVQYFIESISKSICKFWPTETTVNPKEKEKFVSNHYRKAGVHFDDFITLSKSADAKTWCQNHHVSRFAVMLISMVPETFHTFIYRVLSLWVRKRVSLPPDLIALFLANQTTKSSDDIFITMRDKVFKGEAPFLKKGDGKAVIKSGMFQGILHRTSSLYHLVIQEVMASLESQMFLKITKTPMLITKKVGSDDSASLNSFETGDEMGKKINVAYRIMGWKEAVAAYLSVFNSEAKSVRGIIDVIEYNSEWYVRNKSVKPTFRWVSACLETTLVESFITRLRIFSNTLTQTLEGGASTFEASLIQLSQAWLHYKLIGLDKTKLFSKISSELAEFPDPSLGFFPLDPDISAGLLGVDYSIYLIAKRSKYGHKLAAIESNAENSILDYEGKRSAAFGTSMNRVIVSYSQESVWKKIVEGLSLDSMDELVEIVDNDPMLIYGKHKNWKDDRVSIGLKLYNPGVKSSLANRNSLIRMQIASSYILTTPCFLDPQDKTKRKTIFELIEDSKKDVLDEADNIEFLSRVYPLQSQYDEFDTWLRRLKTEMFLTPADFSRKNKTIIEVYTSPIAGQYALIDICKRKWFNTRYSVPLGNTSFNDIWLDTKSKYKFLKDTHEETRSYTGLSTISLKYYLESVIGKNRYVRLNDSSARGSSIYSAFTRIFWPNKKVRSTMTDVVGQEVRILRHNLFCIQNYFFSQASQDELIHELLKNSSFLDEHKHRISPQSARLSMMRDIILGKKSVSVILDEMKVIRGGSVGFFSIRQSYNKNTKERSGPGQWRGQVNDTHVVIDMNDSTCQAITLSNLLDIDHLGKQLRGLIREMALKPGKTVLSPDKIYMGESGRIYQSSTPKERCVPVMINQDLKVTAFDKLLKYKYKVTSNEYSVRLIIFDEGCPEITALSEMITSRDWDTDLPSLLPDNIMYTMFAGGKSCTLKDWSEWANRVLPSRHAQRLGVYDRTLRKKPYNRYDGTKLRALLLKRWASTKTYREEILGLIDRTNVEDLERQEFSQEVSDAVLALREGLSSFNVEGAAEEWGMSSEVTITPDNVEQDSTLQGQRFSDVQQIEEFMELFQASDISLYEKIDIQQAALKGMPSSNNFMQGIISHTITLQPELTYEHMTEGTLVEIPGSLGRVLSFLFGQDFESRNDYEYEEGELHAILEAEMDSSSLVASTADSNISIRDLTRRVVDLEAAVTHSEGVAKVLLAKQMMKDKALLMRLKEREDETQEEIATSSYNVQAIKKDKFFEELMVFRKTMGHEDFGNFLDPDDDEMPMFTYSRLKTYVNRLYEDDLITEESSAVYKEAIKSKILSEELLGLLGDALQINLRIMYDGGLVYHQLAKNTDPEAEDEEKEIETYTYWIQENGDTSLSIS
uniref:RNA-directed RNA polymerase L n=1 Tax=Rhizoctonia cerealis lentinuvirus TaxID=3068668 RepID=A0AA51BSB8_9VIRU|nr:MAG: RNA-dependent RNA polymerase [Rhizoctonia cerealis lentinuvirus]